MDRMLYVAMSGAQQTMLAQATNAHNLANVNTTAFREDLTAFTSHELKGTGHPSRVYALAGQNGTDVKPGAVVSTGRDLDVAVRNEGWIAVQAPDGGEGYTRAGDLRITPNGMLVNGRGHPVLGNSGAPIAVPPAEKVEIGGDGTISIRPRGQTPQTLAVVDRIKLVNPDGAQMMKGPDGLMRVNDGAVQPPDVSVKLVSGSLESSNVNSVGAMVNMIALARQFEAQVQLMKTAEENDSASAQLMRMS